jgi:tetratricopeptide (TPR) repeat protein
MKPALATLRLLAALVFLACAGPALAVSDEATRHFNRGLAAVEMAQSADDYAAAIEEFQRARALAPDWPEVYYNLGLVQEKAGRYRDAAASLRRYLQLAPGAPDATAVRALADKAEFRAERTLSDDDAVDILISLTDLRKWQVRGISKAHLFSPEKWLRAVRRDGHQLNYSFPSGTCGVNGMLDMPTAPTGKTFDFGTVYCLCNTSVRDDNCPESRRYKIEVVSRDRVRVNMRYWYPDITGGGTDDAQFEFVRRRN